MLRIEQLSVAYGPVTALDGVSLDVGKGECVALLGANGAGKTTLLRTISGLVRSKAGSVVFDGKPIDRASPEDRVRAGLVHVPERRRIFPGLMSSHLSNVLPLPAMTYFGEEPTPMMPTMLFEPLASATARSAGPTEATSSDPARSAVRASA